VEREVAYRTLVPDLPEPVYEPLALRHRSPDRRAHKRYAELDHRPATRDFWTKPAPRTAIALAIPSASTGNCRPP